MSNKNSRKTFQAAIKLGFLTDEQQETVEQGCKDSNFPPLEVAIRNGFLDKQQLDTLRSFGSPEDVAPGFRIDGIIGQGGAGVVFKATQLRLNRTVALKTISQHQLSRNELASKRFEREAQIVGQLRHPNIVSAFDFGVHKQKLFLVMEFVEGIDAEKYLVETGALPEFHVWHIALQVCHALNYANENGIIHRDIKPGNLILTSPPNSSQLPPQVPFVKIADFGLARFKDGPAAENITMDNAIGGTPSYMSNEQITAAGVDHRSDIYSLGITLWQLITSVAPITGTGPLDVISNKMKMEDTWLDEAPPEMSASGFQVLRQMCRHSASDRIDDYSKLISEIQLAIDETQPPSLSTSPKDSDHFVVAPDQSAPNTGVFQVSPQITHIERLDDADFPDESGEEPRTASRHVSETIDFPGDFDASQGKKTGGKRFEISNVMFGALTVLAIAIGGFTTFLFMRPLGPDAVKPVVGNFDSKTIFSSDFRLVKFSGPPIFLFDGIEFDARQKSSGKWDVAKGEEGESVLAGKGGFRNFKCADSEQIPLRYFAYTCGFRHNEAALIEYQLVFGDSEPEIRVSITPSICDLYVRGEKLNSSELKMFDSETSGYNVIQIESQSGYWLVYIDGQLLGRIAKRDALLEDATIKVTVDEQGWAHFQDIRLRRFADPITLKPESK